MYRRACEHVTTYTLHQLTLAVPGALGDLLQFALFTLKLLSSPADLGCFFEHREVARIIQTAKVIYRCS